MRNKKTLSQLPEVHVQNPEGNRQGRIIDVPVTSRTGETSSGFTTEDARRFWVKVDRGVGRDDCWRWTGAACGRDGYGGFSVARGKPRGQQPPQYAHRVAYALTHGSIPPGLSVLHRCDNPICVNPKHLFLGTQADNMKDAAAKGRLHVERPNRQKLSDADLIEIDALYAAGALQRDIAAQFSVSTGYISMYLRGARRQLARKRVA